MKQLWKWFLQGIALVAPVALTIALVVWLITWSESTFGPVVSALLPEGWYITGLGVAIAFVVTAIIGLAANFFLVRWLVNTVETVLLRIPLVTILFEALKDVAQLFSKNRDEELGQVVAVDIGDMRLVGFVTQSGALLPGKFADNAQELRVAVYLPMSYQLGGYTVYVPRDKVTPLDISADRAMRAVLTGGSLVHADTSTNSVKPGH